MTTAKKAKPAAPPAPTGNDRFLVLDYTIPGDPAREIAPLRRRVYLLPAHAHFEGFGGSKSGLDTGKTPSLIVRDTIHGTKDFETNLADPATWRAIEDGLRAAAEAPFRAALHELREASSAREFERSTNRPTADGLRRFCQASEAAGKLLEPPAQEDAG